MNRRPPGSTRTATPFTDPTLFRSKVNRGCYDSFAAVYDCPVPVISVVHGFCLGGGIGLVGSSDMILASDDATFGLPEIDRGAMGAATHLLRMFPMQDRKSTRLNSSH